MKKPFFQSLELFAGLLVLAGSAFANTTLETRLWNADNGQDDALVGGAELKLALPAAWQLRAQVDQGRFNPGGDVEQLDLVRAVLTREVGPFEMGAGYTHLGFSTELQPDWSWSYPTEEQERNADAHGPVLHLRYNSAAATVPWIWHAAGSWLPYDLGDFDALGYDRAHLDLEAGVAYAWNRVTAGLGYRALLFHDLPRRVENEKSFNRNRTDGVFIRLTLAF